MKRKLRYIAHRVFDDDRPIEPFPVSDNLPCDGVELDVRSDESGAPVIWHGPVFRLRRKNRQIPKALTDAVDFLTTYASSLEVIMIDVKSAAAAEAVGRVLQKLQCGFEFVFTCWHWDDARILRLHMPKAQILFCMAPIFAPRAPSGRKRDLYLSNSFPFISTRSRFSPNPDKANRHNINVKLITRRRPSLLLPPEVNGICAHRIFWSDRLVDYVEERELRAAVYGLPNRRTGRLADIGNFADYAIIRSPRMGQHTTPNNSLGKAYGT